MSGNERNKRYAPFDESVNWPLELMSIVSAVIEVINLSIALQYYTFCSTKAYF